MASVSGRNSKGVRRLRRALAKRDGLLCHWCKLELTLEPFRSNSATFDHYPVPRSRGGSNNKANLVLACGPCNNKRGSRIPGSLITEPLLAELLEKRKGRAP